MVKIGRTDRLNVGGNFFAIDFPAGYRRNGDQLRSRLGDERCGGLGSRVGGPLRWRSHTQGRQHVRILGLCLLGLRLLGLCLLGLRLLLVRILDCILARLFRFILREAGRAAKDEPPDNQRDRQAPKAHPLTPSRSGLALPGRIGRSYRSGSGMTRAKAWPSRSEIFPLLTGRIPELVAALGDDGFHSYAAIARSDRERAPERQDALAHPRQSEPELMVGFQATPVILNPHPRTAAMRALFLRRVDRDID